MESFARQKRWHFASKLFFITSRQEANRNVFNAGGGSNVRVVPTIQLEGFHSALKKMLARSVSVEVGLRILDLFILKHNLKIGSQYGRNPPLHDADILTLIQTATRCRGAAVEPPQLEFVGEPISEPLRLPSYRSATDLDFGFKQWNQIFETVRIDSQALETVYNALINTALVFVSFIPSNWHLSKHADYPEPSSSIPYYEAAIGFSGPVYSLLRQVRSEQQASGQSWAECVMGTTIMYNIVVSSNTNNCLNLRR
ncbi:hypothetical protein PHMEG_00010043 [Phytophthora megakarya]|uniref:Uncharacterized protein n=1 Tax=Phytophthora megakarya TaxID=4795 RepID=A0A225WGE6_9STRA|nr:hypothetical protein PHMEG_00010043 [Phytophthora megakarya]